MRKRHSATYVEPATLGDLRQIVADHAKWPDHTRVWIRHYETEHGPGHCVEINHPQETK